MRVHAVFRHSFSPGSGTTSELIALYRDISGAETMVSGKPKNPEPLNASQWWTIESHGVLDG